MNSTHEVFNQPEPLVDYNLFETNRPLRDALKFNAPQLHVAQLQELGVTLGSAEMQAHARLANTTRQSCTRTTASGGASTRSSFIRAITS